jgi:hypothetical protein
VRVTSSITVRCRLQLRATYLEKVKAYRQDIAAGKVDWRSPDDAGARQPVHSHDDGAALL